MTVAEKQAARGSCMWCGLVLVEDSAPAPTSHGLCPACLDDILAQGIRVTEREGTARALRLLRAANSPASDVWFCPACGRPFVPKDADQHAARCIDLRRVEG